MKNKDYLIVALLPLALLLIPLTGHLTVDGWRWTWTDFLFAWVVFSLTTFVFRFLVTRPMANLAYNRHNEVNLNLGFVKAAYASTKSRANLALMAGTYANDNEKID